ncbi:MAG: ABC transporter substrate-binding protein [Spongiibacteraceae bacterium]
MVKSPIRIGILNDLADAPPNPADIEQWLRLIMDETIASGRISHPVEFINAWGLGLPSGGAEAVQRAYENLVADDVLMIVGPAIGDNALIATPLAEKYRVPTINWAGSERARSDYMFQLQVGSHEDESIVLARYLAAIGAQRVGVIYDNSPIGHGHLQFFRAEARIVALQIAAAIEISPLAEHAETQVAAIFFSNSVRANSLYTNSLGSDSLDSDSLGESSADAKIDALVYLGLGISAPAVARAVRAHDWRGVCAMNTAGIRGYAPAYADAIDGWIYVDLFSDHNTTLAAFYERTQTRARNKLAAAKGFDIGRLVAEGVARAPELSRDGIKAGLECVKWLPAAQGYDGTLLGFGNFDRGALHGRYLVLRQWRDRQSIEVG